MLQILLLTIGMTLSVQENEDTFYALSSLRYHIENPDGISFQEDEVTTLWEEVWEADPVVAKAYFDYSEGDFERAEVLLKGVWTRLRKQTAMPDADVLSRKVDHKMKRYLIPATHPLKGTLDAIFGASRVTQSDEAIHNAGFVVLALSHTSYLRICYHPAMGGFIFKLPLDNEMRLKKGRPATEWLMDRCEGARNIEQLIQRKKLVYFTVPRKWLYLLPQKPAPILLPHQKPQQVILIADDMRIVSGAESIAAWKTKITHSHLKELFCILSHGYASAYVGPNIPYTHSGQFACVDTEYVKRKIDYKQVNKFLSPEMSAYWDKLVRKGGKV